MKQEFVNSHQLAEAFGIKVSKVQRLARNGRIDGQVNLKPGLWAKKAAYASIEHALSDDGRKRYSDEIIAELIRLVKEEGWSQAQAAEHIGMSQAYASQIINGKRRA